MNRTFFVFFLTFCSLPLLGQSLGDVARENRSNKQSSEKARVVVDDDSSTIQSAKSPFPTMAIEGLDNTEDIIKAMELYRAQHTAEEFEKTVRAWYENYDAMMANALRDQKESKDRRLERMRGTEPSPIDRNVDYKEYEMRRRQEIRNDDEDRKRIEADGLLTARIQQMFMKIRSNLMGKGLRYEWFKIRFGNNNGSY